MQYRRLGSAGLKISAVSLGGWLTYGASVADDVATMCVREALSQGVNYIDLADVYANGEAETVVGRALKEYRRSDLVISSKVFWPMGEGPNDRGLSRKHIMESIDGSLRRLGTEYLDIYFAHRFDPETPLEEVVRAMDDLVHQGKILYWGTSVWSAAQIEQTIGICRDWRACLPQVEQPRYNMLDRHIEPEILPVAARHGMGITVFSPLAQGILTGKYIHGIPTGSRADISDSLARDLTDDTISKVKALAEVAKELDLTMSQLALAWILRRAEISCVIIGATQPEQVIANVPAAEITLTPEVQERIEDILNNRPGA